jgi:hypothetical protein
MEDRTSPRLPVLRFSNSLSISPSLLISRSHFSVSLSISRSHSPLSTLSLSDLISLTISPFSLGFYSGEKNRKEGRRIEERRRNRKIRKRGAVLFNRKKKIFFFLIIKFSKISTDILHKT